MNNTDKLTLGWFLTGLLSLATAGLVAGGLWFVLDAVGDRTGAAAAKFGALLSGALLALLAIAHLTWISVRLIRSPERPAV